MNSKAWIVTAVTMVGIMGISSGAWAEGDKNDFGRTGPYLRGGVAAAYDLTVLLGDFTDTGIGLGVAAGYRAHRYVAVEALFHWLGKTDIGSGGTGTVATVERWDAIANMKLSPGWRVQPYAAVGVGYGSYGLSSSGGSGTLGGFVARFGAGIDGYITRNIGLYIEGAYTMTTGDIDPFDYAVLEAGAIFRF